MACPHSTKLTKHRPCTHSGCEAPRVLPPEGPEVMEGPMALAIARTSPDDLPRCSNCQHRGVVDSLLPSIVVSFFRAFMGCSDCPECNALRQAVGCDMPQPLCEGECYAAHDENMYTYKRINGRCCRCPAKKGGAKPSCGCPPPKSDDDDDCDPCKKWNYRDYNAVLPCEQNKNKCQCENKNCCNIDQESKGTGSCQKPQGAQPCNPCGGSSGSGSTFSCPGSKTPKGGGGKGGGCGCKARSSVGGGGSSSCGEACRRDGNSEGTRSPDKRVKGIPADILQYEDFTPPDLKLESRSESERPSLTHFIKLNTSKKKHPHDYGMAHYSKRMPSGLCSESATPSNLHTPDLLRGSLEAIGSYVDSEMSLRAGTKKTGDRKTRRKRKQKRVRSGSSNAARRLPTSTGCDKCGVPVNPKDLPRFPGISDNSNCGECSGKLCRRCIHTSESHRAPLQPIRHQSQQSTQSKPTNTVVAQAGSSRVNQQRLIGIPGHILPESPSGTENEEAKAEIQRRGSDQNEQDRMADYLPPIDIDVDICNECSRLICGRCRPQKHSGKGGKLRIRNKKRSSSRQPTSSNISQYS